MNKIFILAMSVVPCSAHYILQTAKDGMYIVVWEGSRELLLAIVKSASGKIGIFSFADLH